MAQIELLNKYIWLVDLIYRNDGITREEINRQWSRSPINNNKEDEIPERTFHRHKEAIKELFELDIICDRHGAKTYHIANRDSLNILGLKEWLLNSFALNNILTECKDLKDRILFESSPSAIRFLVPILNSMKENKVIRINYQSFHMDAPTFHEVEPYCLKIYKQRWYLIGRRIEFNTLRTFSLDRVKDIVQLNKCFVLPENFDANEYFKDSIGILVDENRPAESIEILVSDSQRDYIRSLPLHFSQNETESRDDYSCFKLYVQPNHDLIQELLRFGENVEVISPEWFREEFRKIASNLNNKYNKK